MSGVNGEKNEMRRITLDIGGLSEEEMAGRKD